MNTFFKTFVFTVIACFSFVQLNAQDAKDAKADGILDKLSAKIKGQKSFYIEFSATIKGNGESTSEQGKGWVKGDKYCAVYGDNTIISNGLKTWTVVKEEKTVYEADVDDSDGASLNPKKLLTIWETGFRNKYDREETVDGEAAHVIYLYPKNAKKADYHTIVLYIAKADNDLKKVILKSKDGGVSTYSLTKFTSNPTIEDTKFVFDSKKYPGYKVIKG